MSGKIKLELLNQQDPSPDELHNAGCLVLTIGEILIKVKLIFFILH